MRASTPSFPPVRLCDLSRALAPLKQEIAQAMAAVVDRGWFLRGPEVSAFEEEWAAYCGQGYSVGCNSGTDALTLAALAANLTEATVQANTLPLTAIGLKSGGARVVAAEVDEDGHLLAVDERAVPVLLYGRLPKARETGARVFDAAHAHGWRPPRHAIACWSFYPTKTLGALGDAGAVTTDDPHLAREMRNLSGRDDQLHDGRQITSRLDDLQAAVLRIKLRRLDEWIAQRRDIAATYAAHLPAAVRLVSDPRRDLQHLLVVRVAGRDRLAAHLREDGIETKVHFSPPLHEQDASWGCRSARLPGAEAWCGSVLSLPCFPGLRRDEVLRVCESIERWTRLEAKGAGWDRRSSAA